jgi:hypothetical protein
LKKFKIFKNKQDRNQQNYDVDLTKLITPDEVSRFDGTIHVIPGWDAGARTRDGRRASVTLICDKNNAKKYIF